MRRKFLLGAGPLLALLLCACGRAAPAAATPTLTQSSDQMATAFFETLNAPTPTSTLSPTSSAPTDTPVPSGTPTSAATSAPTLPSLPEPPKGVSGCTLAASFVKDVTVPDGTVMTPGQRFNKTWQLKNVGTCTWTKDYKVVFYVGSSMEANTSQALSTTAAPGATISISIKLTAPTTAGSYKGDWLLSDPQGVTFGTELSAKVPFWVQIVVGSSAPPTDTPTP
ncbi:MAG: NBR1-Ig-like domain-containing protein [Dehalococcoidia bacterium]|jgi:hypothetical protein